MSLFTETVTILNAVTTGEDDYGNPVREWEETQSRAWLEQTNSTENTDRREQSTSAMRLFTPLDAPLSAFSRVRWDGYTWEVDGEPGRQPGGFALEGFQVAMIQRTEG